MRAVVMAAVGGPEVLELREWPDPRPGPGEVLVDVEFAGINFMDTGTRAGNALPGPLPIVPGVEAAGRVAELGDGVTGLAVGDRVAWVFNYGSYAERIAVPADRVVALPHDVPTEAEAALMMQGLTAHHFTEVSAPLAPGETALIHAAAGGVGRMLVQLLKVRGVEVIGLVSREEKVGVALDAGADHVLISSGDGFVDRVRDLTNGEGAHAVYDGGGATTFRASLDVLRRHGTLVYYGVLIGDVPQIRMGEIPRSARLTYASFRDHVPTPELLRQHSAALFDLVRRGHLRVDVSRRYPLGDAPQAHTDLASRTTTGKLLLDTAR